MSSFEVRKDSSGEPYQVTITKDKTLWMKIFKQPSSINYVLKNNKWYNETMDRIASLKEGMEIELELSKIEIIEFDKELDKNISKMESKIEIIEFDKELDKNISKMESRKRRNSKFNKRKRIK